MKYKFDIQKDGGVEPVNWDKINLPRSGPTRYPGEVVVPDPIAIAKEMFDKLPQEAQDEIVRCKNAERNGVEAVLSEPSRLALCDAMSFRDAGEIEAQTPITIGAEKAQPPALQEPVGPTPKFNPTSKAWEMPDDPGKSDAVV